MEELITLLDEILDDSPDNVTAFMDLLFGNHQRRGQANDIPVGGFCQQALVSELDAEIPRGLTLRCIIDHDGVQQAFSAHKVYKP